MKAALGAAPPTLGVVRDKVGDIMVQGETGAQILVGAVAQSQRVGFRGGGWALLVRLCAAVTGG